MQSNTIPTLHLTLAGRERFLSRATYHGPSLFPTPEHPRPTLHLTLAGRERFHSRAHYVPLIFPFCSP